MKYETTIEAGLFEEFEARIEFDYEPEEKEVLYPVDDAYPGCPEDASLTSVMISVNDQWIEVLPILSYIAIDQLEEECLENM